MARVNFSESVSMAMGSLWSNKLRTFLTLLGLIIGVLTIIAVVSIIQGLNNYVYTQFAFFGANDFTVSKISMSGGTFDEYREMNNRAKIGLNWSSMDDLNARVFELMAMKLCPVINRVSDLARLGFRDGQHYSGFSDVNEAVEKVLWAKEHPEEAKMIADVAYNKVHTDNLTYDKLVDDVLKGCKLL